MLQYDNDLFPVFHASFPLEDLTFQPNSATTFYELGILYNSVFGTLPASANTSPINIYFDNFQLVEHNPTDMCDFNNDMMCTLADFQLFMGQHLTEEPTLGDFDDDGDNDFQDFQEFENFYDLANLGAGSLAISFGRCPRTRHDRPRGTRPVGYAGQTGQAIGPVHDAIGGCTRGRRYPSSCPRTAYRVV